MSGNGIVIDGSVLNPAVMKLKRVRFTFLLWVCVDGSASFFKMNEFYFWGGLNFVPAPFFY